MTAGQWQKMPARAYVVTAFGDLAANTAESARKGDRVTVTADDIFSDAWSSRDTGEPMSAVKVRASEIALALRFAAGTVTRVPAAADQPGSPGDASPPARTPALAAVPAHAG
jgi:single-stranded DNA-binding protein